MELKRDQIDFFVVEHHQLKIHARLENWSRWCRNGPVSRVSPMFRLYRSTEVWARDDPPIPVDSLDATKMQKEVAKLPRPHAGAIQWQYVNPWMVPARAARGLGVTLHELCKLVRDARQILMNRA